jgi:hypothetical protein
MMPLYESSIGRGKWNAQFESETVCDLDSVINSWKLSGAMDSRWLLLWVPITIVERLMWKYA